MTTTDGSDSPLPPAPAATVAVPAPPARLAAHGCSARRWGLAALGRALSSR